ncbi:MAG: DUF3662 and FHA domain-containing protein [Thermoleophilia bacterium]|nr:DUF3662 and FHA domain-containing protein [Thermoleophilia bacterium]
MRIRARRNKISQLHVQPEELARKLIKEMEDHRVTKGSVSWVPSRYTVFLCPPDYERYAEHIDAMQVELSRHVARRVRSKKYKTSNEPVVDIVVDPDLRLGYFGIQAHDDEPASLRSQPEATAILSRTEAERLGLAQQLIVIRADGREQRFSKSRVLIGRSREADFRLDDPEVSRKHALVFWSEGEIVIKDLESTNGTMVNGRLVSSATVRPGDVVTIGDHRLFIETG